CEGRLWQHLFVRAESDGSERIRREHGRLAGALGEYADAPSMASEDLVEEGGGAQVGIQIEAQRVQFQLLVPSADHLQPQPQYCRNAPLTVQEVIAIGRL